MKRTVIIFTKVPEIGFVKTRLAKTSILNDSEVTTIAKAMLMDTILLSSESDIEIICVGYYPEEKKHLLLELINPLKSEINKDITFNLILQAGKNFDERFHSVVKSAIEDGYSHLVVLGADLPYLHPKYLNMTFKLLERNNSQNVVIGPAGGGGIYLVGISYKFNPDWIINYQLFRGGVEISQFVQLAELMNLKFDLLPPLIDIDIDEDLVSLLSFIELMSISHYKNYYHFPKYTAKIIQDLKLSIERKSKNTRMRSIKKYEPD
ncbi:MAG: DUF2064 domain-containing protein [Promethearchaeota archaeon]